MIVVSSIFDVLAAYFAVLLVEFQEKLSNEKEQKEEDCIGFKISSDSEDEEDEEWL